MPVSKISREEILDCLATVFRQYGYDGATLSIISKATGLGRASLYHHFPLGKEEMVKEVFKHLGAQIEQNILAHLLKKDPPKERIQNFLKSVNHFYEQGDKNCLLGVLVLSAGLEQFSEIIRDTFNLWVDSIKSVLEKEGIPKKQSQYRAEKAVSQIQGALIVSRGLKEKAVFQRMLKEIEKDLFR